MKAAKQEIPGGFLSPRLAKQAWKVVAFSALAFSAWSLYVVAITWGVPKPVALITSLSFDGAAVLAADYSLRHIASGTRGRSLARLSMISFVMTSCYLNVQHAIIQNLPPAAAVLFAAPAVVALLLLEVHARFSQSFARPPVVAQPELPPIRAWAWVLHPGDSWATFRESVAPPGTEVPLVVVPELARLEAPVCPLAKSER